MKSLVATKEMLFAFATGLVLGWRNDGWIGLDGRLLPGGWVCRATRPYLPADAYGRSKLKEKQEQAGNRHPLQMDVRKEKRHGRDF